MTDTWTVTRVTDRGPLNEATGGYDSPTTVTVYTGPGRMQSFESYEESPEVAGHSYSVMRPTLQLPFSQANTANVQVGDLATCTASQSDNVGAVVRIEGIQSKTHMSARRFPVSEVVA